MGTDAICRFRLSALNGRNYRFDEMLPLYGWLEDVDFCRQMAHEGLIVQSNRLQGVHLGTKQGRSSGRRLGYSQVANPWYLMQKGSMTVSIGLRQVVRNLVANLYYSIKPEPWVDRRGRLIGNWWAIVDLFRGRIHPMRTLNFPAVG